MNYYNSNADPDCPHCHGRGFIRIERDGSDAGGAVVCNCIENSFAASSIDPPTPPKTSERTP